MIDLEVKEKAIEILKNNFVCDYCLGRQFAQLLTGLTNEDRGKIIRDYLALSLDAGEEIKISAANLHGINIRNKKIKTEKPKKCSICNNIFDRFEKIAKRIAKELIKYEHDTFLLGTIPLHETMKKEQDLWSQVSIEWCESIRTEINRELGKAISTITGKEMDRKVPDITVLYDFNTDVIDLNIRSLYILGKYQKLVRGIPQTKWKRKIYKTSVQEEIEKPLVKSTKAGKSTFHGSGREDIDVRCLGWRPFVIELIKPKIRYINIRKLLREINKSNKAKVKGLEITDKRTILSLKSAKSDKTYQAIVEFESPVKDEKRLMELKNQFIVQKTPTRVLRRRSNRVRKRLVKDIKVKKLTKTKLQLKITSQAGLYVKEFINGDNERTTPNIANLLNNKVKNIELDVVKIYE